MLNLSTEFEVLRLSVLGLCILTSPIGYHAFAIAATTHALYHVTYA